MTDTIQIEGCRSRIASLVAVVEVVSTVGKFEVAEESFRSIEINMDYDFNR